MEETEDFYAIVNRPVKDEIGLFERKKPDMAPKFRAQATHLGVIRQRLETCLKPLLEEDAYVYVIQSNVKEDLKDILPRLRGLVHTRHTNQAFRFLYSCTRSRASP